VLSTLRAFDLASEHDPVLQHLSLDQLLKGGQLPPLLSSIPPGVNAESQQYRRYDRDPFADPSQEDPIGSPDGASPSRSFRVSTLYVDESTCSGAE
jgi:hypothetical protein